MEIFLTLQEQHLTNNDEAFKNGTSFCGINMSRCITFKVVLNETPLNSNVGKQLLAKFLHFTL